MNFPWFRRTGIIFLPRSVAGWIILIAAISLSVYSFIEIDGKSHSVSDTLMNFVFRLFIICIIYSLIGYLTSTRKMN